MQIRARAVLLSAVPQDCAIYCRQGVQAQGNLQRRTLKPDQDVWAKPQLALQGIAPAARVRLLACALAALEKQISALPDALST